MKEKSMEIKLKLTVKNVEIELSKEEATELHKVLGELVGKKKVERVIEKEYYPWWRYWHYNTDPYIEHNPIWTTDHTVYCNNDNTIQATFTCG